jgi:hypothetical protein
VTPPWPLWNSKPNKQSLHVAIESIDELSQIRESEARRHKEIEDLRQQLADAERRNERLYRELAGRSLQMEP